MFIKIENFYIFSYLYINQLKIMDFKRFYSLNFLGRLFLSAIFINAIPSKILDFGGKTKYIAAQGFPEFLSAILLVAAILVLVIGSFLLIFTKKLN